MSKDSIKYEIVISKNLWKFEKFKFPILIKNVYILSTSIPVTVGGVFFKKKKFRK